MKSNVFVRKYKTKTDETRYRLVVREYGQKERYILLGPVSKRTAEERRIQVLNELLAGTYKREPTIHLYFSEFVEKYFSDFANGVRSQKTIETYKGRLQPLLHRFKGYRLNQITRHHLETYLTGMEVSNRTRNIDLSLLRSIFGKAVEWDYLVNAPVNGIKRFKEDSQGSRSLTPLELHNLLNGNLTAWQKSVIRILVNSGMRPGELSNLKWQDIDWELNRLCVASDKWRKTKNRKARFIPMNWELREELLFLQDHLPRKGGHDKNPFRPRLSHQREYVFCQEDGGKVHCFRLAITRAFKAHGIEGVTPHGLRKTFCSNLARSNAHPRVAQQLLGHSDIRLTMKVYTEVDDDQLREAVDRLPTVAEMQRNKLRLVQNKK